jgi:FkbM family methyltransferase
MSHFPPEHKGRIIELGANDGITLSNSLALEACGWSCMLIEPRSDAFAKLQVNREIATKLHAACGRQIGTADLMHDASWTTRSTIDVPRAEKDRDQWPLKTPGQTEKVNVLTLDFCMELLGWKSVDAISLDVDGLELEILDGFSFDRWKPKVVVLEKDIFLYDGGKREEYMRDRGYRLDASLGTDDGWVRE